MLQVKWQVLTNQSASFLHSFYGRLNFVDDELGGCNNTKVFFTYRRSLHFNYDASLGIILFGNVCCNHPTNLGSQSW